MNTNLFVFAAVRWGHRAVRIVHPRL